MIHLCYLAREKMERSSEMKQDLIGVIYSDEMFDVLQVEELISTEPEFCGIFCIKSVLAG